MNESLPLTLVVARWENLAADFLRERGWHVLRPEDKPPAEPERWMSPKELAAIAGLSPSGIWRRLHAPGCPPYDAQRGIKRIVQVLVSDALLAYVGRPKQPGLQPHRAAPTM
jgi:hypothetical protein